MPNINHIPHGKCIRKWNIIIKYVCSLPLGRLVHSFARTHWHRHLNPFRFFSSVSAIYCAFPVPHLSLRPSQRPHLTQPPHSASTPIPPLTATASHTVKFTQSIRNLYKFHFLFSKLQSYLSFEWINAGHLLCLNKQPQKLLNIVDDINLVWQSDGGAHWAKSSEENVKRNEWKKKRKKWEKKEK